MNARSGSQRRPAVDNFLGGMRQTASGMEKPGAFQRSLLRVFQLPQAWREVFLLKQIQGFTLQETAAILGISLDAAWIRLQRARREINRLESAEASEHAR